MSVIPAKWQAYPCQDYFASELARDGWWDDAGQYWYIVPADRLRENKKHGLLVIGGPGVDGIEWGYRKSHAGIWAYYPLEGEFVRLSKSARTLRSGYISGKIKV